MNTKKRHMKQLGKSWALYWEVSWKYTNLTPSIATVHDGQVLPIGVSIKFLWFGVALIKVHEG